LKKTKKLVLHRETLRVLESNGLTKVGGGYTASCNTTCPNTWDCGGSNLCSAGCTADAGCAGTNNCGSYTRTTIEN
jgi:hypothetical protein